MGRYRGYAKGAGMTTIPAHQAQDVAIPIKWTLLAGSRAQRRRVQRELRRNAAKSQRRQDGGK